MSFDPKNLDLFFKTHNWRFSKCLEPSMTCSKRAIRAHSIQNAHVIELLEQHGHVVMPQLRVSKRGPSIEFQLVGRNEASTFAGLCSEHDAKQFALIDTKAIDLTKDEQLFLLAYRSVTRELHAVMQGASRLQTAYLSRVERGLDPADALSEGGLIATQHLLKAFSTYQFRARHFDQALLASRYDAITHDVIYLDQPRPCLAVSSLFSLDEIWDEGDDDIVRVVLNVFPLDELRTVAIFSYPSRHRGRARGVLNRVLSATGDVQKYELSKLILSSVENFVVGPKHFESWSSSKRNKIIDAFASTIMVRTAIKEHSDLMLF